MAMAHAYELTSRSDQNIDIDLDLIEAVHNIAIDRHQIIPGIGVLTSALNL